VVTSDHPTVKCPFCTLYNKIEMLKRKYSQLFAYFVCLRHLLRKTEVKIQLAKQDTSNAGKL